MYGPAVRCKWILPSWRGAVLHQCIRPLIGACCAPGHHGYQRACDLISGKASSGPFGSSVFACAGKTEPPSRLMQHDRAALIVAHDVERVLTDINGDYVDCGIEFLRHGVLLLFGAPGQLKTLAGLG